MFTTLEDKLYNSAQRSTRKDISLAIAKDLVNRSYSTIYMDIQRGYLDAYQDHLNRYHLDRDEVQYLYSIRPDFRKVNRKEWEDNYFANKNKGPTTEDIIEETLETVSPSDNFTVNVYLMTVMIMVLICELVLFTADNTVINKVLEVIALVQSVILLE